LARDDPGVGVDPEVSESVPIDLLGEPNPHAIYKARFTPTATAIESVRIDECPSGTVNEHAKLYKRGPAALNNLIPGDYKNSLNRAFFWSFLFPCFNLWNDLNRGEELNGGFVACTTVSTRVRKYKK
jgi:hypothetical protein